MNRGDWVVHKEFLPSSQDNNKKVELFWTRPGGSGPYPTVLLVHGHQEQVRNGGEAFVKTGRLGILASRGYVAASLSQPGYGNSAGPADYCGPITQDAVLVGLDFLRKQSFVAANKVAIYGYSRGAVVASMVATKDPTLAAVVLGAEHTIFLVGIRLRCAVSTLTSDRKRAHQRRLLKLALPYIMLTRLKLRFFCCTELRTSEFQSARQKLFLRNLKLVASKSR